MGLSERVCQASQSSSTYSRRPPLILINGLAEQPESWFRNHAFWRRYFDVHIPNILMYDGDSLHKRIAAEQAIDIGYLVEQIRTYLTLFVQTPPYYLVAASLGGKIAVEFAARYPELVRRMVLLCPAGLSGHEHLPIIEGVRRGNTDDLVTSIFHDPGQVDPQLLDYYRRQFHNRRWRLGLLRTIRGTMDHSVRQRLPQVSQPTLLISGQEDRVVLPQDLEAAVHMLPQGYYLSLPRCGHAPQMEKCRFINRLAVHFLTHPQPLRSTRWRRYLMRKGIRHRLPPQDT